MVNPHDEDGNPLRPARYPRPVPDIGRRDQALATADSLLPAGNETVVGVRDGHAIAVDFATTHGLGLTGPGAVPALRALLLTLLADSHRRDTTTIVIPTADLATLTGGASTDTPAQLRVVDDLDVALKAIAAETATPTTRQVLIASPYPGTDERLRTALRRGMAAILLGPWPAGTTAEVRSDGVVTTCTPEPDAPLSGTRLFTMPDNDATALLRLFAEYSQALANQPPNAPRTAIPDGRQQALDNTRRGSLGNTSADRITATEQPRTSARLSLSILGPTTLTCHAGQGATDVTDGLARKHWQLVLFLALHPEGASREAIREALWPNAAGPKPLNAFYATVSQIRAQLRVATGDHAAAFIDLHGERVTLNPAVIEVDYWEFLDAQHAGSVAVDETSRQAAWSRIVSVYRGELAEGMRELWLDAPRQDTHRVAMDTLAALARCYRDRDPQRCLQILEHARMLDRYNEAIYRDIMRTQALLGRADAIMRTHALLTATLAEIDTAPRDDTPALVEALIASTASA